MQMGLGHEMFDDGLQGWVSDFRLSESNQRTVYKQWALMMGRWLPERPVPNS